MNKMTNIWRDSRKFPLLLATIPPSPRQSIGPNNKSCFFPFVIIKMTDLGLGNFFEEPEDFKQKIIPPTLVNYERQLAPVDEPSEITVQLVGKSPLWGHMLWNAGRVTAEWVDQNRDLLTGKSVLELGAAAALPSLLASLVARNVVATDFPDPDLVDNISQNAARWKSTVGRDLPISVQGYVWGHDVSPLLNAPRQNGKKFDIIFMSDLVFNHTEHDKLLTTCASTLEPKTGQALVVFSPHRPKLLQKDLEFFERARLHGFEVTKVIERRMTPMFEEDEETREIRGMVYGYILRI